MVSIQTLTHFEHTINVHGLIVTCHYCIIILVKHQSIVFSCLEKSLNIVFVMGTGQIKLGSLGHAQESIIVGTHEDLDILSISLR